VDGSLDKDLSQWRMYLSYAQNRGMREKRLGRTPAMPSRPSGTTGTRENVFSVVEESGEPVLRISGEIYGCVFTRQEFRGTTTEAAGQVGTRKWNPG